MMSFRPLTVLAFLPFFAACHLTSDDSKSDASTSDGGAPSSDGGAPSTDGGASNAVSMSCYVADQFRCKEFPEATEEQIINLPVECSSTSGVLHSPADCPTDKFAGKCTMGTGKGREVKRVYAGADVAYEQDFCVNTAHGVWSTTF